MEQMIKLLDGKINKQHTPRGRTICLEMEEGRVSTCPKPDNISEWAAELFDNNN